MTGRNATPTRPEIDLTSGLLTRSGASIPTDPAITHGHAAEFVRRAPQPDPISDAEDPHDDECERATSLAHRVGSDAWAELSKLPSVLRDAIALAHLAGFTYAEIAERLDQIDQDISRGVRAGVGDLHAHITERAPFNQSRRCDPAKKRRRRIVYIGVGTLLVILLLMAMRGRRL